MPLARKTTDKSFVKTITLVAALWAAPLHAQDVRLTSGQLRNVAATALQAGDLRLAAAASDAILGQYPDDPSTLLIRTEAAILARDDAGAVSFGQRAFLNANTDRQRFSAARLTALAHANQQEFSRSQLWLRAARQFAPNEAASQTVADDFRAVRSRNPLSVDLRFGISPSTNVNSGTRNDFADLLGLVDENGNRLLFDVSEDGEALSGWEITARANLSYRLRTDATSATFLTFDANGRAVRLTEGSRDRVENDERSDLSEGDLSSATLGFGVNHRFVISPDLGITTANVTLSQSWSGGDPNRRFLTTSLSHTFTLPDTGRLTLSGFSQQQERIENGDRVQVFDASATYSHTFEDLGTVSFGFGLRDNAAEDEAEDFDAIRYRIAYAPKDAFYGVNFSFNLSYEERDFDNVPLIGGERHDEITTLSARAVFSEVELFGFRPVITAERTQQNSSSDLFQRDFTNFGFDIVSAF